MSYTPKYRISLFLKFKHLSLSKFAELCRIDKSVVSRISETTSQTTLGKISEAFPDLNIEWLLTGEGEMLKDPDSGMLIAGQEYREDDVPSKYVTYEVPLAAIGGSLMGFDGEGVRREDCERVVSPIADVDWVVPVCGDSMEPEYPNGSKVFVRQINPRDFISWGNVFVLDTTNGLIIKMVVESERKDCVCCVSLNPSKRYAPFDVPLRTIRAMYRVLACVAIK